ncbi:hypothetical protein GALL_524210 [mine drainage metagenome]|uniref:Uncharacterized protein n=1 Tax=mine drainage metagenome TaxID=410659 RepID=A0A1J5PDX1_9ZZZZ
MPTSAPTVRAFVVVGDGPTRGQTVCDLRGMYMGFPAQDGAHCRVVLATDPRFADEVVDLIASAGDSVIPLDRATSAPSAPPGHRTDRSTESTEDRS